MTIFMINQATLAKLILRFTFSFIFLWAFFDKLLGLGFATIPSKSWIVGVSPTAGFLQFGATGFLGKYFAMIGQNKIVDFLFMGGLLGLGGSYFLGIGTKIAKYMGVFLMILMYLAIVPSKNNPLIDEHIIYALIFWNGRDFGFFEKLTIKKVTIVGEILKRYPIFD